MYLVEAFAANTVHSTHTYNVISTCQPELNSALDDVVFVAVVWYINMYGIYVSNLFRRTLQNRMSHPTRWSCEQPIEMSFVSGGGGGGIGGRSDGGGEFRI